MILVPVTANVGGGGGTGRSVLGWGAGILGTSPTTRYLFPWYSDSSAEVNELGLVVPHSGVLENFNVQQNIPDGNGSFITYTIAVFGVATALSVSLRSTDTFGANLVDAVSVVAGDRLSVMITKATNILASPRNIVATADLV